MKIPFAVAWIIFAGVFTIISIVNLELVSQSGRPGAGFFPTLIGGALLFFSVINLVRELKEKKKDSILPQAKADGGKEKRYVKDVVCVVFFITAFIAVLTTLGGIASMVLFTLGILFYLNRGKVLQNVLISLIFPACLFLLFEVWLRAGIPEGIFGF